MLVYQTYFFVKQQTTITLEGIIDNENVSTFRKYGWPHPPGTEGGGCGEAGLWVPGEQGHDDKSDIFGEREWSYQWRPLGRHCFPKEYIFIDRHDRTIFTIK